MALMEASAPFLSDAETQGVGQAEETQSLLVNNERETDQGSSSFINWRPIHTATIMMIRIAIDVTFKNFLCFYMNYADGLNLNAMQFAYIAIASEIGCMFALFFGGLNAKFLKNDVNIMSTYLSINGIACFLFIVPSYFNIPFDALFIIIWCSICRFIIGISYAFIYASSIHFSTKYISNESQISSMIALLHYSWPLSTILNILAGYIIQYISWIYVWVFCGLLLIFTATSSKLLFVCKPVVIRRDNMDTDNETDYKSEEDIYHGLYVILTDWRCLIMIFVSFFMTFRSRTIYIVTTSLWMEKIFNLSASELGWTTIAIIFGEVLGLAFVQLFSFRYKLWVSSLVCLLIFQLILGSMPLFILSELFGNNIDGFVWIAILVIVLLALGHESFYVVQQTNAIRYSPSPRYRTILLLADRMSQEIGGIVAVWLTATLWMNDEYDFILLFSIIWTIATCSEMSILLIYKPKKIAHKDDDTLFETS